MRVLSTQTDASAAIAGECMMLESGAIGARPIFIRRGAAPRASRSLLELLDAAAGSGGSGSIGRSNCIDPIGLATLLSLGFPIGTRTVLRDMDRVGPGAVVERSTGRMVQVARDPEPAASPPSPAEIVELAMEAVRNTVPTRQVLVPLSGGRDSRLILQCMRSLGVRPRLLLTERGATADAAIACRLASQLEDPIERTTSPSWNWETESWRHRQTSIESLEHGWFLGIALRARALGGPVTDGIGAGVLPTGSLMKKEAVELWRAGSLDALADWTVAHAAGVGDDFLGTLRTQGVPLGSRDEVRHELVNVLRGLRRYPNPLGTFSLLYWTGRGIASSAFGLLGGQNVVAPWIEEPLCRALLAIELDHALQVDWRDVVLREVDRSGLAFADELHVPRRRPRPSLLGMLRWRAFQRSLPGRLRRVAEACDLQNDGRRGFRRAALTACCVLLGVGPLQSSRESI